MKKGHVISFCNHCQTSFTVKENIVFSIIKCPICEKEIPHLNEAKLKEDKLSLWTKKSSK